jgi:hypothetical protein
LWKTAILFQKHKTFEWAQRAMKRAEDRKTKEQKMKRATGKMKTEDERWIRS